MPKELMTAGQLEHLMMTELRHHECCKEIIGIAIIQDLGSSWTVGLVPDHGTNEQCRRIALAHYNALAAKYDLKPEAN